MIDAASFWLGAAVLLSAQLLSLAGFILWSEYGRREFPSRRRAR
ncbi:MAG: hypothetical protein AB7M12_09985 [Hyphomonadaceae bacterium]